MQNTEKKSAFIAIVGRPNVGKSSLLNAIIKSKVTIVSKKPQTTRTRITGIYNENENQIVFLDTPGLLRPKNKLGDYMVDAVQQSIAMVDACVLVVEAGSEISYADKDLVERFSHLKLPAILVINKIDKVENKEDIALDIMRFSSLYDFDAVVPVSALDGNGINYLREELLKQCLPGEHFFDEDEITDQPDYVLTSEIVREKILRLLDREVPHGVAIVIDTFGMRDDADILDIDATIICEKSNHKGIIIGKGGEMLKKIGTLSRIDLEKFFDCKVNLKLWVKVKEDWRNRPSLLIDYGYDKRNFD